MYYMYYMYMYYMYYIVYYGKLPELSEFYLIDLASESVALVFTDHASVPSSLVILQTLH